VGNFLEQPIAEAAKLAPWRDSPAAPGQQPKDSRGHHQGEDSNLGPDTHRRFRAFNPNPE
jgi:hypothetical protein